MGMRSEKRRALQVTKTPATGKQRRAAKPAAVRVGQGAKAADILGHALTATRSSERVPTKWRWHYRVLLSIQSRLLRERGELRHAAAEPLEPHSLTEADSATDEFDHDLALTQLSAEQDALYEVNEALDRIQSGRYGVCEETGKAIPAARLRAVPWTGFTREVEERLEKQGGVPRARLGKAATVRGKGQIRLAPEEEAEEAGERPSAPPNDEALLHVFSAPGRCVPRQKISQTPTPGSKTEKTKRMRLIFYVDWAMCGGQELPADFDLEDFCEVLVAAASIPKGLVAVRVVAARGPFIDPRAHRRQ